MKKANKEAVRVIPLGGLEAVGMNMTAFEYADSLIVVDCGQSFPGDDMPGVDAVLPDITYLLQNREHVRALFLTHGHEDHIGAVPYMLQQLDIPIYGTRLTLGILRNKLEEFELPYEPRLIEVGYGSVITEGDFSVEFIRTNHSIADSAALAIESPAGIIFHTGDFKIDYTPVYGDHADLQRFGEIGKKGVLALLCDSTNAIRDGFTNSEKTVGRTIETIFTEHPNNRLIVATFASNVDRVQQIINCAIRHDRKVVVEGRSMVNIIGTASELGYINIPEGTLIDAESMKDYPDNRLVLITTGSQGESMAALSRMAASIHRRVSITPNDVIILSSNPIPGNEKSVAKVINDLCQLGATVIHQNTHVSGHACAEEIKLIYSLVEPQFAVPVHGEFRHRQAQARIAKQMGMDPRSIFLINSGDVLELSKKRAEVIGQVTSGTVLVDGLGVGDVGNIVLRDRQLLSQDGIIVVSLALDPNDGRILAGPEIFSRGFVYVREAENLIEEATAVTQKAVDDCLAGVADRVRLKNVIRDALGDFLWQKLKRRPMILPIIMECDV